MKTYKLSMDDLLESKKYVNESSGIEFPSAKEYAGKFAEIFEDAKEFNITAVSPVINAEEDGVRNIA
jgi:hypothetical protein